MYLLILIYFRPENITRSRCDQSLLFGSRNCQDRKNTESFPGQDVIPKHNFTEEFRATNNELIPGQDQGTTVKSHQNLSLKIVAMFFIVLSVVFFGIVTIIFIRRRRTLCNVTRSNERNDHTSSETPTENNELIEIKVVKRSNS